MGDAVSVFCRWLERTPFSRLLQDVEWIIPAVQTVHILAVAALLAAALLLDLRVLGIRGTDQPLARLARRYLPALLSALPVLLATGAVMIAAEPARALKNPAFQLKMALLLVAILVTTAQFRLERTAAVAAPSGGRRRRPARALAALSILLWVAIVFAGRWIAYRVGG